MKVNITQRLNGDPNLIDLLKRVAYQLNQLSEGSIVAKYNAVTAPPTTGRFVQGDFIANSAPSELGGAGSKYVITGWICTVSGNPATFVQARVLTGN